MSDKQYFYDDKGHYLGHTESSPPGVSSDGLGWAILIYFGFIAILVGIFGGIWAMIKFVFWACLILGGICLGTCLLVMVLYYLFSSLNKIFNLISNNVESVGQYQNQFYADLE